MDTLRADDGTGLQFDFPDANILEISAGSNVTVLASQTQFA